MATKVYKYDLVTNRLSGDITELELPKGAQFCAVAMHTGFGGFSNWCVWFRVDPTASLEIRRFQVFGTGHPIDDDTLVFLGTFFHDGFVWHLFESPVKPIATSGRNFTSDFGNNL